MVDKVISNQKGVTLIEILAVVALLSIIGLAAFPFLTKTMADYQDGITRSSLFKEAQLIESELINVVRNTSYIPDSNDYLKVDPTNEHYYSFYSGADRTEKYKFLLEGSKLTYIKDTLTVTLSENVIDFSLREEGTEKRKLIYSIHLGKVSDNGDIIEISLKDKSIYFPDWTS